MTIVREPLYRCDICGLVEPWDKLRWIAHTFYLSKIFGEYEFHVCGEACDRVLTDKTRQQRLKMAREILNHEPKNT